MAVQKRSIFTLNFFCATLLKIMHFEPPPPGGVLVAVIICHFAKYPTWKRFSIRDIFLYTLYRWKITKYRIDKKIVISPTNNAKINVRIIATLAEFFFMIINS